MEPVDGAATFMTTGRAYDGFMGRYSRRLAPVFADWAGVRPGHTMLDVGCGPGALTGVLVERLGAGSVAACDPSEPFVRDCRAVYPEADLRVGRAEALPFDDDAYDGALAQLVFHFVSDPETAAAQMCRVVRAGGVVAACSWDFAEGMQMLRVFWDAALAVDPAAPDEAALRFGGAGEFPALFETAGCGDVAETTLQVTSGYASFEELWSGFLAGIGPAGAYCVSLPDEGRAAVRAELFERLGRPSGGFELRALARAGRARAGA